MGRRGTTRTHRCPDDHNHADYRCYNTHRCGCEPCTTWARERRARQRRTVAYGRSVQWVPAGPTRARIAELRADGWTWKEIGDASGVHRENLRKLHATPTRARVRSDVAEALARPLERQTGPLSKVPAGLVDATGTRRRLQALVAHGWMPAELARRMGRSADNNHGPWHATYCTRATRDLVLRLYADLWDQPAPPGYIGRARGVAARHGWVGALAWEDIDDPTCQPDDANPVLDQESGVVDEAEHLLALGEAPEQIIAALGTTRTNLTRTARRHGRPDIARAIGEKRAKAA